MRVGTSNKSHGWQVALEGFKQLMLLLLVLSVEISVLKSGKVSWAECAGLFGAESCSAARPRARQLL